MKPIKYFFLPLSFILLIACNGDEETGPDNSVEYKQKMRDLVIGISQYTKGLNSNFIIIPQNGQEILTTDGNMDSPEAKDYLNAIDGVGREDLFYGYDNDDVQTPSSDTDYMIDFLDAFEKNGIEVLTTDYCSTPSKMDDSYRKNANKSYISFSAPERELNVIPTYPAKPFNENADNISTLSDAKNFLYIINSEKYANKQAFIESISQTNYDVIIMDMFFEDIEFTSSEILKLKTKMNGGKRLIIAYMSIGEAEDYRYYWKAEWKPGSPSWIKQENPDWPGNYKVNYWEKEWQDLIYGGNNSYSKSAIDAGFDGLYLDIIDAFEYFE